MADDLRRLARSVRSPGTRSMSEEELYLSANPLDELRRTVNTRAFTPEQAAENRAATGWEALSVIPGPGNAISAYDAYNSAGDARNALLDGDYKGAAIHGGLSGLSALGAVLGLPFGKLAKGAADAGKDTLFAIPAWHGSPHDFDKFDMSKIGSGEGAQAYGHGLYFAGNRDVAETYQKTLSPILVDGKVIDDAPFAVQQYLGTKMRGELDARIAQAEKDIAHLEQVRLRPDISENPNTLRAVDDMMAHHRANLSVMKDVNAMNTQSAGRLYHTELDVEPEDLLDWDKPLSQQNEKIRNAVAPHIEKIRQKLINDASQWGTPSSQELSNYAKQADDIAGKLTGKDIYERFREDLHLTRHPPKPFAQSDQDTSRILREAGIPGIRFLDQGSRGAGAGTSNYVIFDDTLVKILSKE